MSISPLALAPDPWSSIKGESPAEEEMKHKILFIDGDDKSCGLMRSLFEPRGYEISCTPTIPSGIQLVKSLKPDLVILGLKLPMDGTEVIEKIKCLSDSPAIVVITNHPEIKAAIRTAQIPASDYLTRPIDEEELFAVVRRALEEKILRAEVNELRKKLENGDALTDQFGPSAQSRHIIEQVNIAAPTDYTVLLVGETGTGKEVVARALFNQSERRKKPYIAIDCGAIPGALLESELFGHEKGAFSGADRRKMGQFQLADGGTILLDEIGNLPVSLQPKLLRVLESKYFHPVGAAKSSPMNVRFIAATNYDLQERVHQGLFRADLYFRLAQYAITLSPLRERPDDIPFLAQRFLEEAGVELRRPVTRIRPAAAKILQQYNWPGNVRELKNVMRQAILKTKLLEIDGDILTDLIGKTSDVHQPRKSNSPFGTSLKQAGNDAANEAEKSLICEALRISEGNKTQAARDLKTDFKTLHLKMRSLGIRAADFMP